MGNVLRRKISPPDFAGPVEVGLYCIKSDIHFDKSFDDKYRLLDCVTFVFTLLSIRICVLLYLRNFSTALFNFNIKKSTILLLC